MAFPLCFFSLFYIILFSCYFINTANGAFSYESHLVLATNRMEKMTHLHFYFHDILDGESPSAMRIINPPSTSSSGWFGTTFITDDPLTEGPEPSSKLVGKAQGIYSIASQNDDVALLMVMNFAFTEGIYNRSTLSILGRNPVSETVREISIVGGSGVFRFARGYALAKTVRFDSKTGSAVVEYNVSVSHF